MATPQVIKRYDIKLKPYQDQLLADIIEPLVVHKKRKIYNPITKNIVRNTKANRVSIQAKIDKHNEEIMEKLIAALASDNKSSLKGFFKSFDYVNTTHAPHFEFIDDVKYKTIDIIKRLLTNNLKSAHSFKCFLVVTLMFKKDQIGMDAIIMPIYI